MKNLINSVQVKLIIQSLQVQGVAKNICFAVEGNRLSIGEIVIVNKEDNSKCNVNFNKEKGGNLEIEGNQQHAVVIKDLKIQGNKGQELSFELLELNSASEGIELFASIMKQ